MTRTTNLWGNQNASPLDLPFCLKLNVGLKLIMPKNDCFKNLRIELDLRLQVRLQYSFVMN